MSVTGLGLSEAEHSELVALLQRLIQFPTEDPPGRELELARFVHDKLVASGITSDLIEFQPDRANVVRVSKDEGSVLAWSFPPISIRYRQARATGGFLPLRVRSAMAESMGVVHLT